MHTDLGWDYTMRTIVFLSILALSAAEGGYQYQANGPPLGYETDALLAGNHESRHATDHADYHKHFYAFEAPFEPTDEAELIEHKIAELTQKNLHVVFIKAPENKAVAGALHALAKQTSEDKTAIYVLNKQTDSNELASKLSALQTQHNHKPQVHFVKYRTEAEAAHAQQHIQAQYGGAAAQRPSQQEVAALGYSQHSQLPLPESSLGYAQPAESPLPEHSLGYAQQSALTQHSFFSQESAPLPPSPQPSYLPPQPSYIPPQPSYIPPQPSYPLPSPSYAGISQGYAVGVDQGNIDLPPLPLPQQQLSPNPYDLDARSAKSLQSDFRANERRRSGSRMVFPSESTGKSFWPPKRRRSALF